MTKARLRIAIVWYFPKASQIFDNWRDGLRAAVDVLKKKHDIEWFLDRSLPPKDDYDFVLFWDDSDSGFFDYLDDYPSAKKGICLTTDPHNMSNLRKLDVVFCESEPIYQRIRAEGIRCIRAFGTDTDFFAPTKVKKDIEYFYPATFSPWKLQRDIAYLGDKLFCVGTVQPDGELDYKACVDAGVKIREGYIPPEDIRDYYDRTKKIIIPAIHGSERTVLEAMSMNILPEVINPGNRRTKSFLKEYAESGCKTPREFVVKNYSHYQYAADLLRGME